MILPRQKQFGLFWNKAKFEVSDSDLVEGFKWIYHNFKYSKLGKKLWNLCMDLDDRRILVDAEITTFDKEDKFINDAKYLRTNLKSNEVWPVFSICDDIVYYHKRLKMYSVFKDSWKERRSELDDNTVLKNKVINPEKEFKQGLINLIQSLITEEKRWDETPDNVKFLEEQLKWINKI